MVKFKQQDITYTNLLTIDIGTQSLKMEVVLTKLVGLYKSFQDHKFEKNTHKSRE